MSRGQCCNASKWAGVYSLNARLRAHGFTVYDPDVTMFTMGGGGVHCMCQPLRRDAV